jgi:hypothetical protein
MLFILLIAAAVINLITAITLHGDFNWLSWFVCGLTTGAALHVGASTMARRR